MSVLCLGAGPCRGTPLPTQPDATPEIAVTTLFNGAWVGASRVISCSPPEACASYPPGRERYFAATFNQQAAAVDGSVILSPPDPLALPYGFAVTGHVGANGQLRFDRVVRVEREPGFRGTVTVRPSSPLELVGHIAEDGVLGGPGQPVMIIWEVAAVAR